MSLFDSIKAIPSNIGGLIGDAARIPKNIGSSFMSSALQGTGLEQLYDSIFGSNQVNTGMSLFNNVTKSGLTGQQIAQNEWTAQREDTAIQRQVADMVAAGLNPALLYGGSSPSGSPSSPSAQQSSGGLSMSDMLQAAMLKAQIDLLHSEALKNRMDAEVSRQQAPKVSAEASKIRAEESRVLEDVKNLVTARERMQFDLDFVRDSRELDMEGKRLANQLSEKRIVEIDQKIDESKEKVRLLIEEENSEQVKRVLMLSEILLNKANSWQIEQLVPFQQRLMSSQSDAQTQAALLSMAHAAYQNGLIDNGFIEETCRKARAESEISDIKAALRSPAYNSDSVSNSEGFRAISSALYMMNDLVKIF